MNTKQFLENNFTDLILIIKQLDCKFNSHEFIEKFAKKFEVEYIELLCQYKNRGAFQNVHSQIGLYLSENSVHLGIRKTIKTESRNIFGDIDKIQEWEKM